MKRRTTWLGAAAASALYFAAASWLDRSFIDPTPQGSIVIPLQRPFERSHFAVIDRAVAASLAHLADDDHHENDARSPLIVYEDNRPLGPGHSTFADVDSLGRGRFAHWRYGVAFSASDNSDPNTNGRRYWAVVPKAEGNAVDAAKCLRDSWPKCRGATVSIDKPVQVKP